MRQLTLIQVTQAAVLAGVIVVGGCDGVSAKQRIESVTGGPLKTVIPVAGVVTVDGRSEGGVQLILHKSTDATGKLVTGSTFSQADGRFSFTTYQAGDGVVPGEYKITFEWAGERRLPHVRPQQYKQGRIPSQNQLNGRYNDPATTKFTLSVVEGKPQKDLKFALSTKD